MSVFTIRNWSFPFIVSLALSLGAGAQTLTPPNLLSPTNNAMGQGTSVTLNWGTVSTAVSYTVDISTSSNFVGYIDSVSLSGANVSSYAPAGLITGMTYYWMVNATNGADSTSAWSAEWTFSIPAVPPVPTLLTPANNAVGQSTTIQLNWGTVSTAVSYTVDISTSSAFIGFVDSVSFAGANASSYVPAGLITGMVYYWKVNATNAADSTSAWSAEWSFSTLAVPAAPTLSSPTNASANQPTTVTLAWTTAARATSYAAEVSTVSSFASTVFLQAGLSASPEVVSGLSVGTLYYWRVNGNDASGNGAWSTTDHFTTALPAPTLTSPSNGATGLAISLTLQWSSVTRATTYTVAVSTSSAFASTVLMQAGLSTSSYAAAGLANGTTFYWRANATDAAATSPWTGAWNFTTIVAIPTAPVLSSPTNGSPNASTSPTLSWGSLAGAASYTLQLSTNSSFSSLVLKLSGPQTSSIVNGTNYVTGLTLRTVYFWEVNATNVAGTSAWSGIWSFTVNPTAVAPTNKILAGPSFTLKNGTFAYTLNQQGPVEIMIYNILGRKVFAYNRLESSGSHALSIKNLNLSPELYIVHFKANGIEKELSVMGKRSD